MNYTPKSVSTLDASAAPSRHRWAYCPGRRERQRPVRPMAIVVVNEDAKDIFEMLCLLKSLFLLAPLKLAPAEDRLASR